MLLHNLHERTFQTRVTDQESVVYPFKVRICEHVEISSLTGKTIEANDGKLIAIQKHLFCCNHFPSILTVK